MAAVQNKRQLKPGEHFCYVCGQAIVEPLEAKCEVCEKVVPSKPFPAGWFQRGQSKYGKQYQRAGVAWFCPTCKLLPDPNENQTV